MKRGFDVQAKNQGLAQPFYAFFEDRQDRAIKIHDFGIFL